MAPTPLPDHFEIQDSKPYLPTSRAEAVAEIKTLSLNMASPSESIQTQNSQIERFSIKNSLLK